MQAPHVEHREGRPKGATGRTAFVTLLREVLARTGAAETMKSNPAIPVVKLQRIASDCYGSLVAQRHPGCHKRCRDAELAPAA
jgi:hypothetical protein